MKYIVWTLLVWVPVLVLMGLATSGSSCGENCIGPSNRDLVVLLVVLIGLPIYGLGLLLLWWLGKPTPRA